MIVHTLKLAASVITEAQPLAHAVWIDESGAGLMEYALLAALISLCAVASMRTLASRILGAWNTVATGFEQAV